MGVKVRYKKLKGEKKSIYLDIVQDGKRKYEFLKDLYIYNSPKNAEEKKFNRLVEGEVEKIVAERNLRLLSHKYDFAKPTKISGDFISLFKEEADARYKRRGSKSNTYCCYKHLVKFTGGVLPYEELSEDFANNFKEYLLENLSTNCAKTYFLRFKMVITKAHRGGIITIDPTLNVKPIKEIQPFRETLTIEEVKLLKGAPCKVELIKRMFLFSCYTGLRISDLKAIKWSNVREGVLVFNPVKTKHKIQRVPLNENAKLYMGERGRPDENIFPWPYDPMSNRYDALKEWIWMTGINRNITWHTARHTYATLLYDTTGDLKLTKEALGHSRIETTEIYAKLLHKTLVRGVNSLDNL